MCCFNNVQRWKYAISSGSFDPHVTSSIGNFKDRRFLVFTFFEIKMSHTLSHYYSVVNLTDPMNIMMFCCRKMARLICANGNHNIKMVRV